MTREEEIKQAIENNLDVSFYTPQDGELLKETFYIGAKWADKNPQSPWISVKDDLPCNHKELISTQDKATKKVIVMEKYDGVMVDFMKKAKSGVWYWSRSIKVLYWMPIPELPKE